MKRFLISSGWIFVITLLLVVVFIPFDPRISERAQALPGAIVGFNKAITNFGTFRWMLYSTGLFAIIAYIAGRFLLSSPYSGRLRTAWRLFAYFFLTIGSASIFVHILKFMIGRGRPELYADIGAYSLTPFTGDNLYESFPSGHSTAAGAFFGAFAMLIPRFRYVFMALALIIGISRVIVGAHYPSDVAAGLLLGIWTAMLFAFIFARKEWLFRFVKGWPYPKNTPLPPADQA